MPVETAQFIPQLNTSYPQGEDGADQGDNHIRLLKALLISQFPQFTNKALEASQSELENAVAVVTGLAALKLLTGSAAAPGASFADDEDTGFFLNADGEIGVALAGALAALFDANGLSVDGDVEAGGDVVATGTVSGGLIEGPGVVPIGAVLEWYADSLPASKYGVYAWANGSTVSAATYDELAALWPSRVSDGLITLPDRRETAAIGSATMGGVANSGRITAYDTATLFGIIGADRLTLLQEHLPNVTFDVGIAGGQGEHNHSAWSNEAYMVYGPGGGIFGSSGGYWHTQNGITVQSSTLPAMEGTAYSGGSDTPINLIQPTIICNFVVRIA